MIFWTCILMGVLFAWIGTKIGFYETLVYLLNTIISIYLAVFLAPVLFVRFPAAGDMPYSSAIVPASIALGTFVILFGIAYVFLTGQFKVAFPKVFDLLFAGILGFVAGFLVSSFLSLMLAVTPLSQNPLLDKAGLNQRSLQNNLSYVCRICDAMHWLVSKPDSDITSRHIMNAWLDRSHPEQQAPTRQDTQIIQPDEPNDPNGT